MTKYIFSIPTLGPTTIHSPLKLSKVLDDNIANYVNDDEYVIYNTNAIADETICYTKDELMEKAGPRGLIYFNPSEVHAAIITCGGLCPGSNDVIRSVVMTLWYQYGVRKITGVKFGYRGFFEDGKIDSVELSPQIVLDIHRLGGTILGSSRGNGEKTGVIVDALERNGINVLFTIGGDGTQKGALALQKEIDRRGSAISIIGIPKTIDNDLSFIERSFGFETAVSKAVEVVNGAHIEARDAINGICLVKLMGRDSGFIAAHTTIAVNDVNFILVPEVPFDLDGENGFLHHLKERVQKRAHAVIVVAEGAGQEMVASSQKQVDASGNRKLGDVGTFLKDKINQFFQTEMISVNLRYIDPGYIIRSTPADPGDSIYCARLGTNAVHAAMSGRTGMIISMINNSFVHVPFTLAVSKRNRIDPESALWRDVILATGQPYLMKN